MRGLLILVALISLSLAQVNQRLDCTRVFCAAPPAGCQRDGKTCCGYVCPATTCQTNSQCGVGSFCKKSSCSQTATGTCTKIPQMCPLNFQPVCGCDGKTYGNGCGADASAMTVQSTGECPTTPSEPDCSAVTCVSFPDGCERKPGTCCEAICPERKCQTNSQCGEGSFCLKDSCSQNATGDCTKIPEVCPANFAPVCGCNGRTYGNRCGAGTDSMSVHSEGECPSGCQTDSQCGEGSFCKKDSCSQTATGNCTKISRGCTREFRPVCGCNGKTYGNKCTASADAMSIRSEGSCSAGPSEPDCSAVRCMPIPNGCQRKAGTCCEAVCPGGPDCSTVKCAAIPVGCQRKAGTCCEIVCPGTCQTDSQCEEGSFCKKTSCSQTATGACAKIPRGCPKNFMPVCGCNGRTYSNRCGADVDRMAVRSQGRCQTTFGGPDCSTVRCAAIPAGCQRRAGTCCDIECPGLDSLPALATFDTPMAHSDPESSLTSNTPAYAIVLLVIGCLLLVSLVTLVVLVVAVARKHTTERA